MVKNTTGGSKTKGQARKFVNSVKQTSNLRISNDECEVYAQVTKMLGNGMCHVLCIDQQTRLCHIRGKFRGRGKRDNFIGNNSWILVGLREWELEKDKDCKKLILFLKSPLLNELIISKTFSS
jgi:translation initiation factor 1A